jgi:putative membrane protein
MAVLATLTVSLVAFIHIYILILEMFLWTTPRGLKSFGLAPSFALQTKALAANQGLYNGFLASGLAWGVLHPTQEFGKQIQLFFLLCVAVAGIFGAVTTGKGKIFFVQSVPAAGAILALCFV